MSYDFFYYSRTTETLMRKACGRCGGRSPVRIQSAGYGIGDGGGGGMGLVMEGYWLSCQCWLETLGS